MKRSIMGLYPFGDAFWPSLIIDIIRMLHPLITQQLLSMLAGLNLYHNLSASDQVAGFRHFW